MLEVGQKIQFRSEIIGEVVVGTIDSIDADWVTISNPYFKVRKEAVTAIDGGVAKLVDALGSNPGGGNTV